MISANNLRYNPLNNFCIIGINFHKSDIGIRSKYSLSESQKIFFLKQSNSNGIKACFALSTCNRTELYAITAYPETLIEMLCNITETNPEEFLEYGYIYQSLPAVEHLFKVASGLDSQIVGDNEILGQLKEAIKIASDNSCINNLMERIINYSFRVSKEIKTKTKLNSGIVSVSYAAIEIIRRKVGGLSDKNIVLVGAGKFGNSVAKNLKSYLSESSISFINRTDEKAELLAKMYERNFIPYADLASACNDADIIIVSSSAEIYTIVPSFFITPKPRLILDLSVPENVEPSVRNIEGTILLNLDEVSLILDKTVSARQSEIPVALKIINDTLEDVTDWCNEQSANLSLRLIKSQLYRLSEIYFMDDANEERIHKTISGLAIRLKSNSNKGCQCLIALNNFLQKGDNYNMQMKNLFLQSSFSI